MFVDYFELELAEVAFVSEPVFAEIFGDMDGDFFAVLVIVDCWANRYFAAIRSYGRSHSPGFPGFPRFVHELASIVSGTKYLLL